MNRSHENNGSQSEGGGDRDLSPVSSMFLKCRSSLRRYISRFIRHPHDIEDIVHETYLRSYTAEIAAQIRSPKSFLFKTARNLALKHLDKSAYRLLDYVEDLESLQVLVDEVSAESRVESHEQFIIFCRAVSTLPVPWRRAFILRKVYGLSHKEIARQLDLSVSTVEKHLASGIVKCGQYMRAHGLHYTASGSSRKSRSG